MIDYIRDGQEIYRQSFATIRAEADLSAIPVEAPQFRLQPPHSHTQRRNLRGAFVAQLD